VNYQSFLQAILDAPEDDNVRLIFADWLEEHGQPERAEFIRVRCALARMDDLDPRYDTLRIRAKELFEQHGEGWKKEVPKLEKGFFHVNVHSQFVRGFVEQVTLRHWKSFNTQAKTIFASAPVRHVHIVTLKPRTIRSLARSPLLAQIRSLAIHDYSNYSFGDDGVRVLAGSPHAARLAELHLDGARHRPLTADSARALASATFRASLTGLEVRGSNLGDQGAAALAEASGWEKLTSLKLGESGIGPAGAAALARSPSFPHLARLELGFNPIGLDGARALARSPHRAALTRLSLFGCGIPVEGVKALATSPSLPNLRLIHLDEKDLPRADQERLRRRFGKRVRFGWGDG
jgi:uncharacterized protein (TIGR02996 family)